MRYKHIIFDIDGTLIDTEKGNIKALQDTLLEIESRRMELHELAFSAGIPGEVALGKLGVTDVKATNRVWNEKVKAYAHLVNVFDGIRPLLDTLKGEGYRLGIITSKYKEEYRTEFLPHGLADYFETVICVEDASHPKPSPYPMLKYLELTGASKEEALYIGDSMYDMQCATAVGVDCALALWGCDSAEHIRATYYLKHPQEVLPLLDTHKRPLDDMPWLKWAMELQFIAQAGITYSQDPFDIERFERIREISAEIMSLKTGFSPEQVKEVFCNETGFQTPKLDTRAAIFKDGKILLVEEKNGTWSLPGGWVDVLESVRSNTVKEVKEEAGLDIIPVRLIAVQDRNLHNEPVYAYGVCKVFVLCEVIGGAFQPNTETLQTRYFGPDELPRLALEKNTPEQVRMCFEAADDPRWQTFFD